MSFASVRQWLVENTLLEPALLEGAGFEALVAERVKSVGGGESAYLAEIARSPEQLDRLIAGIAVPETWLFRYPRSYELLLEYLQRRLASGAASLRMLSIGCATGQEPYCMAMTALHAGWPAERMSIEGLDRNAEFLRAATRGEYGAASIRTEIPAWAMSYLQRSGTTIAIDPAVRGAVRFRRADATDPATLRGGACDVIFCRNLLIYLSAAARAQLLDAIAAALVPDGLLFTGHAEQMLRGTSRFRPVPASHAFALERANEASAIVEERRAAPPIARPRPVAPLAPSPIVELPSEDTLDDALELADAGRTEDGEAMIRSIIARRGPTARACELLGMIRMSANDALGAKRFFEQAVYLEPRRATSLLQLAIISERSGNAQGAATLWDRARRASASADEGRRS